MEKAPTPQNLQDSFLNQARRDRVMVAIYLMSGVKLTGRIRGFDKYSVILESGNQEQMIFKHAISTVSMIRPSGGGRGYEGGEGRDSRDSRDSRGDYRDHGPRSGHGGSSSSASSQNHHDDES